MGWKSTPRLLITYSVLWFIFEETFITVMCNFVVMPFHPSFMYSGGFRKVCIDMVKKKGAMARC